MTGEHVEQPEPIGDRANALIRTVVPALVGIGLARLAALLPIVAELEAQLPPGLLREGVSWLATAAVVAAYYATARALGRRWPSLERWLLGSSATPTYRPAGN